MKDKIVLGKEVNDSIYNRIHAFLQSIHIFDKESGLENHSGYFTLCSGGIKEEGESIPIFCSTPELAIELFMHEFRNIISQSYMQDPKDNQIFVVWRRHPELVEYKYRSIPGEEIGSGNLTSFYVCARLAIEK